MLICVPNKLACDCMSTLEQFLVPCKLGGNSSSNKPTCELEMCTEGVKCDTYKLHGAVVDKEVLNLDSPVWSEF